MPEHVSGPVTVQVPASSANLGPGFDALALALDLHDVVTAEVIGPPGAPPEIVVEGEGARKLPRDESHLVHRALRRGCAALGTEPPQVRLHCRNVIPHGRGMGSSAAAIVAGLWLARRLVLDGAQPMDDDRLFAVAADIEGHPDNVAAAVYGGLTVAYTGPEGPRAARLDVPGPLSLVLFVPPDPVETTVARGLLPAEVPHVDAAHAAGRAALLVAALTGQVAPGGESLRDALLAATDDRLHQPYRAPAMRASLDLVASLRADGVAAVVSGAGPTVLALLPEPRELAAAAPQDWRVVSTRVDPHGARSATPERC